MQVFDLKDEQGRVFAFEVDNSHLSRNDLIEVLGKVDGVRMLRLPKKTLSQLREEEFCEFGLGERIFTAWEPYGDNSRYWIGPIDNKWHPEIETVREALLKHRPGK